MKILIGEYSRNGYRFIELNNGRSTGFEYVAGNCQHDSDTVLTPGEPGSLPLWKIRKLCLSTGHHLMTERKLERMDIDRVSESDL